MSAFANLPISRKLVIAFAAVAAVIIASRAVVYDRLGVIEEAKNWRVHSTDVLDTLDTAMHAMLDQETSVRGYFITGDERSLEPYSEGSKAFPAAFRRLKDLTADNPAQQGRLDELNELVSKWRSTIAEPEISLMTKRETREDARALEKSMAGKTAMDLIRAKVEEIATVERDLLEKRVAVQNQAFSAAYMATILGGAASLVITILMGILLTRGITVPITGITNAMTALARGNTEVEVPRVGRKDEIGAMAEAVQVFKDSIIERHRLQAELGRANRLTTVGQLTASIAHEVSQPIAGVVDSGRAALRWLANESPDLEGARRAIGRVIRDAERASDVIGRIRDLVKRAPPQKVRLDINEASSEVIALTRSEVLRHGVALHVYFERSLPCVQGDRIQLQQVLLNLILNAIEAMSDIDEGARELMIRTGQNFSKDVLITVEDSGPGLDPEAGERLFDPFYTTKPDGMGMGLAICRSIIEAHGGQIWASANEPQGAVFQFTLPPERDKPVPPAHAG